MNPVRRPIDELARIHRDPLAAMHFQKGCARLLTAWRFVAEQTTGKRALGAVLQSHADTVARGVGAELAAANTDLARVFNTQVSVDA